MDLTQRIIEEHSITTLMITHNLRQALEYGNKTIIMNEGRIVAMLEGEQETKHERAAAARNFMYLSLKSYPKISIFCAFILFSSLPLTMKV